MQIHSLHRITGRQKSFSVGGRSLTLALIREDQKLARLVRDEHTGVLHFDYDRYNLLVTDRGSGQRITIAGQPLQLNQPRVWLAHQELLIGEEYLLTWEAERGERGASGTRHLPGLPALASTTWPTLLGAFFFNPRFLLTYLTTVARRRFLPPLERISPRLLVVAFALLVGLLGLWLYQSYAGIRAAISSAPTPTLTPTPTVPPVRMATSAPTPAPPPKATLVPTVVLVVNRTDVVPSPTNTLTVLQVRALTPVPCRPSPLPPAQWDERLDRLGIRFAPACVRPDEPFWHLVEAKWLDVAESNGYHHVFVDVLDQQGERVLAPPAQFVMQWTTDQCERSMQSQSDPLGFGAHCPMFAAGTAYTVYVQGLSSDRIEGLGLGTIDQRDWSILTSFQFKFQHTVIHSE